MRAVAKYADGWNFGSAEPDDLHGRRLDVLRRDCADVGRDVTEIEISAEVFVRDAVGDLADRIRRLEEAGARHLIVALVEPDVDLLERVAAVTAEL